tara:strand:- start:2678 stop:3352 length:675 start_codon:yes stop_codon:yes gene_type:complete
MIKLCVSNKPVAPADILKSNFFEGIQLEKIDKSNINNLSHSQDSLFETSTYFFVEDSLLTKADLSLIVEKELNIIGTISKNTQTSAAEIIHSNKIEVINIESEMSSETTPWALVQSILDKKQEANKKDLLYFSSDENNFRFLLNLLEKDLFRFLILNTLSEEKVSKLIDEKIDFKYEVARRRLDNFDEDQIARLIEIMWKIESVNTKEYDIENSKRALIALSYV